MLDNILAIMGGLAGLGALSSMLINVLKKFGAIQDGESEKWFGAINIVAFITIAVFYFIEFPVDWGSVDGWLQILASLLGLVLQTFSGRVTYGVMRGRAPLLGFHFED